MRNKLLYGYNPTTRRRRIEEARNALKEVVLALFLFALLLFSAHFNLLD